MDPTSALFLTLLNAPVHERLVAFVFVSLIVFAAGRASRRGDRRPAR